MTNLKVSKRFYDLPTLRLARRLIGMTLVRRLRRSGGLKAFFELAHDVVGAQLFGQDLAFHKMPRA